VSRMTSPLLSLAAAAARLLPLPVRQAFYRLGPVTGWLRRALNRAAPAGLVETRVASGDLAGAVLLLDLQTEKDYWLGTYEPQLQAAVRDWVQPGVVVYDVGANIGYVTLLLARAAGDGGRVFAFEALPGNLERLHLNLERNRVTGKVTIFAGAVVQTSGPVDFLVHASGGMGKAAGSPGRDERYTTTITVPGVSLDDFVYRQGNPVPQVIKMDIEGGEVQALPGMRRLLAEGRPLVLLELHGPESAAAAWKAFSAAGYTLSRMQGDYPAVTSPDHLDWKAYLVARPEG
jgi:FkbM family methyltransferase